MKKLTYIFLSLLVLAGCTGTSRQPQLVAMDSLLLSRPDSALTLLRGMSFTDKADRMYHSLLLADACNKCYDTLPSDSILQEVTDYYDHHGTPNEQVRAHYLLGCAYRDMGEAPMALQCYQQAIECADTTVSDCDFSQLSRVYGQMGLLLYDQSLYRQHLIVCRQAAKFALLGKDTLPALIYYEQQSAAYRELNKQDSAVNIIEDVSRLYSLYGYKTEKAIALGGIVNTLIRIGEIEKARDYMQKYENESGLFNTNGEIERGREVYYYPKGLYYLKTDQLDSADYWFRKELSDGKDFNNQNGGALGLAMVYEQRHMPDSSAKYYQYAYAMNDSLYAHMAIDEVARMQAMYDYTRHQEMAYKEKEIASHRAVVIWICIGIIVLLSLVTIIIIERINHKRLQIETKYMQSLDIIRQARQDIEKLKASRKENNELIAEKEMVIHEQKDFLKSLPTDSLIYKRFTIQGKEPTTEEWHQIEEMVFELFPKFQEFINNHDGLMNDKERKACILIRAGFKPKSISNMLGVGPSYISNIRTEMLQRIFGKSGGPKEFDRIIRSFC